MTQSLSAVRSALLSACRSLYAADVDSSGAPVGVFLGLPGSYQPDYLVLVAVNTRQPVRQIAQGGIQQRDAEVDIIFSVYVPGDEGSTATAADACDALVDKLDHYLQTPANKSLSGACETSWVSNIEGPELEVATHPESGHVMGRLAVTGVTVTARLFY